MKQRAQEFAKKSDRPAGVKGIALTPLQRKFTDKGIEYSTAVGRLRSRRPHRDHHHPRPGNAAAGEC